MSMEGSGDAVWMVWVLESGQFSQVMAIPLT